jgi:hypothetical protein
MRVRDCDKQGRRRKKETENEWVGIASDKADWTRHIERRKVKRAQSVRIQYVHAVVLPIQPFQQNNDGGGR